MATVGNKVVKTLEKGSVKVNIIRVKEGAKYLYYPSLEDGRRTNKINYPTVADAERVGKSFLDYIVNFNLA